MARPVDILHKLPLPLAQVLTRSLNAKSQEERHNCAYFLGEAALKLACAGRVGAWVRFLDETDPNAAKQLESLLLPSTGDWLRLLRLAIRSLGSIPADRRPVPFAGQEREMECSRPEWTAAAEFASAVAEGGVVSKEVASISRRGGMLGFFGLLVAYRNKVIGHGAQRFGEFYDRFSRLMLEAVIEVLTCQYFLADHSLVKAEAASSGETIGFKQLTGPVSVPAEGIEADLPPVAGHLYLAGEGMLVPLHPLVVYQQDEFHRERVGFLNGTVRRVARQSGEDQVRRVDYLDYASGEPLVGIDTRATVEEFLARVRGRKLSKQELTRAEERSAARAVSEGEERVDAGMLIGDFEIESELGRGGMGVVYLARQLSLRRTVALKVLHPMYAADPLMASRFRREVMALGMSDHPNVVKILASGRDGDRLYYAMEYVEGVDLAHVSRVLSVWKSSGARLGSDHIQAAISSASGDRPTAQVYEDTLPQVEPAEVPPVPEIPAGGDYYKTIARLFAGAARGLRHLHQNGIIHRDIKPGNLMVTSDCRSLVLTDLGLAKVSEASRDLSRSQAGILGTLRYMAPEQLQRNLLDVDERADVYGLGATLYEVATGKPFFEGEGEKRLIQQVLNEDPVPPRKADKSLPKDLESIITVATAKRSVGRYAGAEDCAADLEAFADDYPIRARPPGPLRRAALFSRRRPAAVLVVIVSVLMLVAVIFFARPRSVGPEVQERWYANVVERWGAMEGVGLVTDEQQRQREMTYRIVTHGGRTHAVSRVNGVGKLRNDSEGVAVRRYKYTQDGRVHRVVCEDRFGNVVMAKQYDWTGQRECRLRFVDRFGKPLKKIRKGWFGITGAIGKDVFVLDLTFSKDGYIVKKMYQSGFGEPRQGEDGSWGMRYERDGITHLPVKICHLKLDGTDGSTRSGISKTEIRYDAQGNVVERSYFGVDGSPLLHKEGCARVASKYNKNGNRVESACFGLDGKPVLDKDGRSKVIYKYDKSGNEIEELYKGTDGRLIVGKNGCSGARRKCDERGNLLERICLGIDGEPRPNKWGIVTDKSIFNERDLPTKWLRLGIDGKPVISAWAAYEIIKYDQHGFLLQKAFFGADGKPTLLGREGYGCAGYRIEYDERGNVATAEWLDAEGELMLNRGGYARHTNKYDERGNEIESKVFRTDGRLVLLKKCGIARWTKRYDERGNEVERSFFGTDGRPVFHKEGYARFVSEYNQLGNMVGRKYFGSDGMPVLNRSGFARSSMKYDSYGNVVEVSFFGIDYKPALGTDGYARWRAKYDERGKKVEQSYYGVDDKPIKIKDGFAKLKRAYDERGNKIEESFFGIGGNPVLGKGGRARVVWKYDELGNLIEEAGFGVDGRPVSNKDGYARCVQKHDERGNVVSKTYFGVDDKPVLDGKTGCARVTWSYDEGSSERERACFGLDGKPAFDTNGCARLTKEYNERGNLSKESCFDVNSNPAVNNKGCASVTWEYDDRDNVIEESCFSADDKPIPNKAGFAHCEKEYDERDNVIRESFYGIDDEPVLTRDRHAAVAMKYDERDNVVEKTSFGIGGELVLNTDGCARLAISYDERGEVAKEACFDVEGKLVRKKCLER